MLKLSHINLLAYPYSNEEFKIHTDASKLQLGSVIIHEFKLIALYIRKKLILRKGIQ